MILSFRLVHFYFYFLSLWLLYPPQSYLFSLYFSAKIHFFFYCNLCTIGKLGGPESDVSIIRY